MKIVSKQILIKGRVQNVGFRFHTRVKAMSLGLVGFVQNKNDGSVYVEVEGEQQKVLEFELWCNRGPDWARVVSVYVIDQPCVNYVGFDIKR